MVVEHGWISHLPSGAPRFLNILKMQHALALIFHKPFNFLPQILYPLDFPIVDLILAVFSIKLKKEAFLLFIFLVLEFFVHWLEFSYIYFMLVHRGIQTRWSPCKGRCSRLLMLILLNFHKVALREKASTSTGQTPIRVLFHRLILGKLFYHLFPKVVIMLFLLLNHDVAESLVLVATWNIIVDELPHVLIIHIYPCFIFRLESYLFFLMGNKELRPTIPRKKRTHLAVFGWKMVYDVLPIVWTNVFASQIVA